MPQIIRRSDTAFRNSTAKYNPGPYLLERSTVSMLIGVLEPWQDATYRTNYHIKRSIAEDLVERGFATWVVPAKTIQKLTNERLPVRVRAPRHLGSIGAASIYELALSFAASIYCQFTSKASRVLQV
jgi:hypothetical protein